MALYRYFQAGGLRHPDVWASQDQQAIRDRLQRELERWAVERLRGMALRADLPKF